MASDGILPSNGGRGYVMRRLLRRAARHGRMLGISNPFLVDLVDTVIRSSEEGYPELREHEGYIKKVIGTEEASFYKTIDAGMNILNNLIDKMEQTKTKVLSGLEAFRLNDTFGFPLDLTREIMAEAGYEVDEDTFHAEMKKQKERARAERLAKDISGWSADLFGELTQPATVFTGYDHTRDEGTVIALSDEKVLLDEISAEDEEKDGVLVILDKTPFYAEMGGQVADHGTLQVGDATLQVLDVKKTPKGYYVHTCVLENGTVRVGDSCTAQVDTVRRMNICRNHTGAHLLQKALREVLGDHVHQAGSYQDDQRLRFDFTHFSAVTPEELAKVEEIVNAHIYASIPVTCKVMPIEEAKKMGAMALFGEKYGDEVRVVDIDSWSTEFCGGTHVSNTAQIGCFKIVGESSVAAGVRRVEAVTGANVVAMLNEYEALLKDTAASLKANNIHDLASRADSLVAENKTLAKDLADAKAKLADNKIEGLFQQATDVDGVKVITAYMSGTGSDTLRSMADKIRDRAPNMVAALVGSADGKITLAVSCSKNPQARGLKAGDLVKEIAAIAGGKGGGKPDFAMAGLKDANKVDEALNAVADIVKSRL